MTNRLALWYFIASCAFITFAYGVLVGKYEFFPYTQIREAVTTIKMIGAPPHYLNPRRYDREGAATYRAEAVSPGLTLLTSYWPDSDWRAGLRLINASGDLIHAWDADPTRIWPDSPHTDHMTGRRNVTSNYVHGAYLFENGDVVFNIEAMGLARLNAKSEVVWRLDYRTHHSISRDEHGDFWVSGLKWLEDQQAIDASMPGLSAPLVDDILLKVSPEGEVLREISVLDLLYANNLQHLLWKTAKRHTGDVTHLNDIEALSSEMAGTYPLFEAGDLVVSLKYINAVLVVDPDTEKVKWLSDEPFIEQHDPDFIGDGWISIFDNRMDGSSRGTYLGGSRIVAIQPHTGETRVLYKAPPDSPFYTEGGGKTQLLPNGNLLITEAEGPRVFEVGRDGDVVWEWIQTNYNETLTAEVMEGTRYPLTEEHTSQWERP